MFRIDSIVEVPYSNLIVGLIYDGLGGCNLVWHCLHH